MIYFETERLVLRNYTIADAEDYYEYMKLEETALHEDFEPFSFIQCEQAVKMRVADDSFWVVELKKNKKVIGDICYRKGDYNTYEIGYDFNPDYGKQGYATEACGKLIDYIFTVLDGRRLYVGCNEDNKSSWKLLERLGLRREAHCIEDVYFKKDEQGNPIYVNSYFYAMLRREWADR
jgi:Acetyltransferases, including N-acetylases of ribosomal proteins